MNTLNEILELAKKLPSGIPDIKSFEKMNVEWKEFINAIDYSHEVEEAVDVYYYAIKTIQLISSQTKLTLEQLHKATIAKYSLRALPGNPKNKQKERNAMMKAIDAISV